MGVMWVEDNNFFAYCFTEEYAEPLRGKRKIGELFSLYMPILKKSFIWNFSFCIEIYHSNNSIILF